MPRRADICSILLLVALSLGGCVKSKAPQGDVRAMRLAELEAMGRKCGYSRSGWMLFGTDELRLKPNPNERFEAVDCILREIRKSDLPFKMAFVGNEAFVPGNGQ